MVTGIILIPILNKYLKFLVHSETTRILFEYEDLPLVLNFNTITYFNKVIEIQYTTQSDEL